MRESGRITRKVFVWVEGSERERLFGIESTYCWLCWWQCNCLPFLRPGWQCWPHWPSAGPGRGGPLWGMRGTNCPWRHHHETEQHPLLSPNKEIPLDRDTGKGNSRWMVVVVVVEGGVRAAAAEKCDRRQRGPGRISSLTNIWLLNEHIKHLVNVKSQMDTSSTVMLD